ncbi:MAG: riboflavin synthase [Acidimicrobiia bacterium]
MFTGIVTELGRVESIGGEGGVTSLSVVAPQTSKGLVIGDSIAVNGVCLTAVTVSDDRFVVEAVPETLERTSLGALAQGSTVNLERPLASTGRFDGHIVQGHVDGVGEIVDMTGEGGSVRIRVTLPQDLSPYLVEKGSITVDGTSLTVTGVSEPAAAQGWFEFVLIPHTLDVTTFGSRRPGDAVNLEVDVIAKYVERMLEGNQ